MASKKRKKLVLKEATEVVEASVAPKPVEKKKPEYIVTSNLKDDGTKYKAGDKYEGNNIDRLLKAKAIELK